LSPSTDASIPATTWFIKTNHVEQSLLDLCPEQKGTSTSNVY
jgi:hypothetical protein